MSHDWGLVGGERRMWGQQMWSGRKPLPASTKWWAEAARQKEGENVPSWKRIFPWKVSGNTPRPQKRKPYPGSYSVRAKTLSTWFSVFISWNTVLLVTGGGRSHVTASRLNFAWATGVLNNKCSLVTFTCVPLGEGLCVAYRLQGLVQDINAADSTPCAPRPVWHS